MDTASAASEGNPEEPAAGPPPSIGVSSIPAQADQNRLPGPVPSVPVPSGPPGGSGGVEPAPTVAPGDPRSDDAPTVERPTPLPAPARRAVPVVSTRARPLPVERETLPASPDDPDAPEGPAGVDPFEMAFPPGVAGKLGWYVYLLAAPGSGHPFYVGRGRGDRCFRHVQAARTTAVGAVEPTGQGPGTHDADQAEDQANQAKTFPLLDRIRDVEAAEGPVRLEILRYGLSASEARLVEATATDALGLPLDPTLGRQRGLASELGTRLAKRAKFKREHQVVLMRVGGKGADTAYGTVRHGWRIGRRWTDPQGSRSPRWAVIVAGEIVVAVYRIDGWEPTPVQRPTAGHGPAGAAAVAAVAEAAGAAGPAGATVGPARSTYRHSFIGERDDELEHRYVGRSVAAYLGVGAAVAAGGLNQVTYVWCGPHLANPPG
jgi:hypothetical protein